MTDAILPTEQDGEWVGEALDGILPEELDARVWVQGPETEFEGKLANQFHLKGQNLYVLATVAPLHVKDSDTKKVSYHVIAFRREGDKIKKPNPADISRVKGTFFGRELRPGEKVHEGPVGDSRAYHFMTVFEYKPVVILGA
jgi:hypothetical protein